MPDDVQPGRFGPAARWEQLRDQIHHDVVTQAFDPRVLGTIVAIRRELSDGGLVKRYQTAESDDGVKGSEGLFIACSF
jgi:hypothetical protein